MPSVSFNVSVVLLVVGTVLLMVTQAFPAGWPWRRTVLTVCTVAGLACVFAGGTGLAQHVAP